MVRGFLCAISLQCVLLATLGFAQPSAAAPETAPEKKAEKTAEKTVPLHELVARGITLFAAGKLDEAQESFAAAEVSAPENYDVAYNRGRTYHAQGNAEQAKTYYLKALRSPKADLAARAEFNLGTLSVAEARALLGEDPVATKKEDRDVVLGHLDGAVERFRGVLTHAPDDPDARYNIELIRVWAKDIADRWRRADRDKARKDLPLEKYLEYLMAEQKKLESATGRLESGAEDDGRRVRLEEIVIVQGELREEIPPLEEKVREHVGKIRTAVAQKMAASAPGGGNAPGAPPAATLPDEVEKRIVELETSLLQDAGASGGEMKTALESLDALAIADAAKAQAQARKHLDAMWQKVAPFLALLDRAIDDQGRVIEDSASLAGESAREDAGQNGAAEKADGKSAAAGAPAAAPKLQKAKVQPPATPPAEELAPVEAAQAEIAALMPNMMSKARAAAHEWAALAKEAEAVGPNPPQPAPGQPQQPSAAEMKKAFEKAVDLLPEAETAVRDAVNALQAPDLSKALEAEREAAKILEEIRKLFQQKKDDQKQDDQKKDDQKKDDKKDEQNKDKKDEQKQDQKDQQKDQKQDQKQDQKDGKDEQKAEERKLDPKDAKRLLEKMKEARNKREKKRRAAESARRVRVERDW